MFRVLEILQGVSWQLAIGKLRQPDGWPTFTAARTWPRPTCERILLNDRQAD